MPGTCYIFNFHSLSRTVGISTSNCLTQLTLWFRQEKVVSTLHWGGRIMQDPGLHMAPQSGVPLEYIKCITFSQRAGWGPSCSIWPPVPFSFSATKTASCLHTVPVPAQLAFASLSSSGWGSQVSGNCQLDQSLAPFSSLWDLREVCCPSEREFKRVTSSESKGHWWISSFEIHQPWGCPYMGEVRPLNVGVGCLNTSGSLGSICHAELGWSLGENILHVFIDLCI